jgi:hypothetical protein
MWINMNKIKNKTLPKVWLTFGVFALTIIAFSLPAFASTVLYSNDFSISIDPWVPSDAGFNSKNGDRMRIGSTGGGVAYITANFGSIWHYDNIKFNLSCGINAWYLQAQLTDDSWETITHLNCDNPDQDIDVDFNAKALRFYGDGIAVADIDNFIVTGSPNYPANTNAAIINGSKAILSPFYENIGLVALSIGSVAITLVFVDWISSNFSSK